MMQQTKINSESAVLFYYTYSRGIQNCTYFPIIIGHVMYCNAIAIVRDYYAVKLIFILNYKLVDERLINSFTPRNKADGELKKCNKLYKQQESIPYKLDRFEHNYSKNVFDKHLKWLQALRNMKFLLTQSKTFQIFTLS